MLYLCEGVAAERLHGVFLSVKMDGCGRVAVRLSDWTRQLHTGEGKMKMAEEEGGGKIVTLIIILMVS